MLPLQWRQVDFAAGTVRLDPGTTKNGEGRVFPMTAELRALLEAQRAADRRRCSASTASIIPHVFHREGRPIRALPQGVAEACKAAGCPGRIRARLPPHRGPQPRARRHPRARGDAMTGHKTRSVFERYNIVSEGDLADAARRLDEAAKNLTGTIPGTISADEPEPMAAASPSS